MALKDLRRSCGFRSQASFGRQVGVTGRTVRRWENGESEIPSGRLIPVSRSLGVSVEYLLEAWAEMDSVDAREVKICGSDS